MRARNRNRARHLRGGFRHFFRRAGHIYRAVIDLDHGALVFLDSHPVHGAPHSGNSVHGLHFHRRIRSDQFFDLCPHFADGEGNFEVLCAGLLVIRYIAQLQGGFFGQPHHRIIGKPQLQPGLLSHLHLVLFGEPVAFFEPYPGCRTCGKALRRAVDHRNHDLILRGRRRLSGMSKEKRARKNERTIYKSFYHDQFLPSLDCDSCGCLRCGGLTDGLRFV